MLSISQDQALNPVIVWLYPSVSYFMSSVLPKLPLSDDATNGPCTTSIALIGSFAIDFNRNWTQPTVLETDVVNVIPIVAVSLTV